MSLSLTKAAEFLERTARPLELRAYETIFKGASFDGFADALEKFRCSDGGFGNALEPDVRTPYSQPLFVDFALKSLYQVGARVSEFGVGVCDYLRLVSESNGALPYLLPNALEYPRAKQWQTLNPPSLCEVKNTCIFSKSGEALIKSKTVSGVISRICFSTTRIDSFLSPFSPGPP